MPGGAQALAPRAVQSKLVSSTQVCAEAPLDSHFEPGMQSALLKQALYRPEVIWHDTPAGPASSYKSSTVGVGTEEGSHVPPWQVNPDGQACSLPMQLIE